MQVKRRSRCELNILGSIFTWIQYLFLMYFTGPRREHINYENTTLELRKIPHELNTIAKLNEHFSKFGNIVNLQVSSLNVLQPVTSN